MNQTIQTLFYPTKKITKNNIHAYRGKHILEKHLGKYVSTEEFEKLMRDLGYEPRRTDGRYILRLRKEHLNTYA